MAKQNQEYKAKEQEKELVTEQSSSVATQEKPLNNKEIPLTEHQKFQLCNLTSGNRMSMKDALALVRKQQQQ